MSEKKLLVVVDMQEDFINGSLATKEAKEIVNAVIAKIQQYEKENNEVVYTLDTHDEYYLTTQEGKHLPVPHCIKGEDGWLLSDAIDKATKGNKKYFEKNIFGSLDLANYIKDNQYDSVEMIGVCTDICVVSNALIVKSNTPEIEVIVDASCCAGVNVEKHLAALEVMKSCQVIIHNE